MRAKTALWLLTILGALTLSSCAYTKIGAINADPMRFSNRRVRVEGNVTNSFGALGTGGYQLQDETGKIFVITNQGVPSRGARVAVNGTVMSGVTVMGRSYGTTIQERDHRLY